MAVIVFFSKRPVSIPPYTFSLVDEANETTIAAADVPELWVRINGGAWQTLTAASLTCARTANHQLTISGFTGSETSIEFMYEYGGTQDVYDNTSSSTDNTVVKPIWVSAVTQHLDTPGIPLVPNYTAVVAS